MAVNLAMRYSCFCDVPCLEWNTKEGVLFYKCGIDLDYGALTKRLAEARNKFEKKVIYDTTHLGCKMNLKAEDRIKLDPKLFEGVNTKDFPKCLHQLFAKVGVSHSAANANRTFFSCAVNYPDTPCSFFLWSDDFKIFGLGGAELFDEQDRQIPHARGKVPLPPDGWNESRGSSRKRARSDEVNAKVISDECEDEAERSREYWEQREQKEFLERKQVKSGQVKRERAPLEDPYVLPHERPAFEAERKREEFKEEAKALDSPFFKSRVFYTRS